MPLKKYLKNLNNNLPNISLYIHFPWWEKKCPYCDFNVTTVKKDGDIFALTEAVINDISLSKNDINNRKFQSVYFGGGTPSLVPEEYFKKILDFLRKKEMIDSSAEITVEFNPKEANKDKIASLLSAGINRISLGVQSFDDLVLNQLGRNHSAVEAKKAIANLGWEEIKLPAPVFVGDTLYSETEVLDKRESKSRPTQGIVRVRHIGKNQDNVIVMDMVRSFLVAKRGHSVVDEIISKTK